MKINKKLFISLLLTIVLAFTATILAWMKGDSFRAGHSCFLGVLASVITIIYYRKLLAQRQSNEVFHPENGIISRKLEINISRVTGSLIVVTTAILLVRELYIEVPFYYIFRGLWLLPLGIANLLFAPEIVDEGRRIPNPVWLVNLLKRFQKRFVKIHEGTDPYKFRNTDDDPVYIRELLSCTTCIYNNKEATQKDEPWCKAPSPPEIKSDYCQTFKPINKITIS